MDLRNFDKNFTEERAAESIDVANMSEGQKIGIGMMDLHMKLKTWKDG